jgi:hypothetical protein
MAAAGFVEKTTEQGGLAGVDAAAGDEAEQSALLVTLQVALDLAGELAGNRHHREQPSACLFFTGLRESRLPTRP